MIYIRRLYNVVYLIKFLVTIDDKAINQCSPYSIRNRNTYFLSSLYIKLFKF